MLTFKVDLKVQCVIVYLCDSSFVQAYKSFDHRKMTPNNKMHKNLLGEIKN